jgi:membrane protease subunit HflK
VFVVVPRLYSDKSSPAWIFRQVCDGYRLKRLNEAEGDASRFNALLAQYVRAPEVTRRRIYVETMQEVLPRIRSKVIVDQRARSILPLLNLDLQSTKKVAP